MNRLFHAYAPYKGEIRPPQRRADLQRQGEAVAYAMWNLEDRGPMMIEPGGRSIAA
jgi:GTP-binding protein